MTETDLYLHEVTEDDETVSKLIEQALSIWEPNIIGPNNFLAYYEPYHYIFIGEAKKSLDDFMAEEPFPFLKDFARRIDKYKEIRDQVMLLRNSIPLNLISLECGVLNKTIVELLDQLCDFIVRHFQDENYSINRRICDTFDEMSTNLGTTPETVVEIVQLTNYAIECRDIKMYNLKEEIRNTADTLLFLMEYALLPSDHIILNCSAMMWPRNMENVIEMAWSRIQIRRDKAEQVLRKKRQVFETRLEKHFKQLELFKKRDPPLLTTEDMEDAVQTIEELNALLQEDKHDADFINEEEQLLDFEVSPYTNLQTMLQTIEPFDKLWHTALSFTQNYDKWYYGPFAVLDADEVREEVESNWRTFYKLIKTLQTVPGAKRIAEMMRAKVEKFRQFVPVLETICNKGLQERHWKLMSEIIGVPIELTPESALCDMIDKGMSKFIPKLEEISASATKEFALLRNLRKMKEDWDDIYFDLAPYRDTGVSVLTAVDDIQVMLDDNILKAQTMRGSPYVKAFEEEMTQWEEKLISIQDIIDAWLACQSVWMYLEPIFSSEDINRQMPLEARNFKMVDKTWRTVMTHTVHNPHVLTCTDLPKMLDLLHQNNKYLDEIQKGLNDYLEKKRLYFPRFFFLSNDELLEILSETKDPLRVQPHLKKCFEGISSLDFYDDKEIVGMISAEGENVPLSGKIFPADAKGMVEKWLMEVQQLMIQSMKDIFARALKAYVDMPRPDWVLTWPGQVVQAGDCIFWTTESTEAIRTNTLSDYRDKCTMQIEQSVELVRGELPPNNQVTVEALIVIDVHGRDIIENLSDIKVTSTSDFNWISQLRYYFISDNIDVCQITTTVAYGFEYLGNTGRLVATPLTDRCYRTLMGALKLNLGGAPEGPAGTGKTETVKDLAKAVGKKCVVFNCSDGLDYKALGKFFKGLAQCGAWSCFDEFNRIDLEVLSVVAQQILSIQLAIAAHVEKFIFEGTELTLDPTCSVFITMNPGYAGRSELPDNLKVLFRTVAMMVPDYAMIGEITLYSNGFTHAKILSQKIVHTYKLCSEQLSSQHHYDYGMRAVKSVLLAAGTLKRTYPQQDEYELVFRAIIDVNAPKFLAQDIPLFEGIYSDLFPGTELPKPERDELEKYLRTELEFHNLQSTPWYIEKVMQIYEMIQVRHGLMIVGEPMGGKTCAYQRLADACTQLAIDAKAKMKEYRTLYSIMNPKAITLGQLYGSFDPASHEWSDGVLANIFREYSASLNRDRKWIIFDGPVDAVWIENMNTVLDDNKKLCLMSGEIIQMTNVMNLIFEPADLEQASPATVSRCGMIYMEPSQLGWRPLSDSYLSILHKRLLPEQFELFEEMVNWLVPACFHFMMLHCKLFVQTSNIHLFHTFTRIFACMLEGEQVSTLWLQCITIFCLAWGLGCTMTADDRRAFDVDFRKLIYGEDKANPKPKAYKLTKQQLFPERGLVFDFYWDKKNNGTWINWVDLYGHGQTIPTNANLNEIIVQTNESCCQKFFLNLCLNAHLPIMMLGPTGTGKSAVILNHMLNMDKDKYLPNVLNFSAQTTAGQTQEVIMSKLDRRRRGVFGPSMGKKCVLFIDDVGMPQKEQWGSQPPVELLRQFLDHGHWYDLKDTTKLELTDILFVCAMGKPGGGANMVTGRFTRHHVVLATDSFDDVTLTKIFTTIMEWHFARGYEEQVARFAKMLVSGTLEVFRKAMETFLPTPTKSHYTFSLRDFTRVIRGVVMVPPSKLKDSDKLTRLWIHESYRVFYDRLIDNDDRQSLFNIIGSATYMHFRVHLDKILAELIPQDEEKLTNEHIRNLFFGNFMLPDADPKIYDEIDEFEEMVTMMEYYLNEYNMMSRTPMHLVMFKFAIEHVSRVSRVIIQDNGNCLLVGIGGSGRHSSVKLAASMSEYAIFEIEISRNYGVSEWRDDLKKLMLKAGIEGKPIVFLFSDTQIAVETFTEDINMILNTGDIPNLYQPDEKADILEKMQGVVRDTGKKIETTPLALYNFFIERVRSNLHIALAMSPIGDSFRIRIRMFPSLINCCTIDWFLKWPNDALEKVATMFFDQTDLDQTTKTQCITMCEYFHLSMTETAEEYYEEMKRRTYVTPTSYLELIRTFQTLYRMKVDQITTGRNRYETGLDKLDFAAGQVGLMQDELFALQPQLVVASEITEKLMIKIEQDTVEVEKKKEIVGADEALANEAAAAAQAIKDDCESDLAEAMPALEAAMAALDTLKPADITLVKSMKNPPYGVKLVMEAVCVMMGAKPDRKPDPSGTGRIIDDYWGTSLKLLGDLHFLDNLKTYNKDNIPPATMRRIRERFISDRDFDPESIKKVSSACEGLCKWVRAMEVYDRVIKIVAPKKERLGEAEAELAAQMDMLNEKRAQLQEVTDKLQALNDELACETKKKKDLEDQIELCSQKLDRAEKLIGGLGGEKSRWSETAKNLHGLLYNVVGDVILSAGMVAYLGPFTVDYRHRLITDWNKYCFNLGVPCSENFSLALTLGEPVVIRYWNICGLPVDGYSIENGIIATRARRWPLMVDPQSQANKWVKNMEKTNRLQVIKLTDKNYVRVLENAIQFGTPVLLENVGEEIDAVLDPILVQNVFRQGGINYLKFGDNVLEYSEDFKFYITTRLRNPHYLPEIAVKVTLLNFMITPQGLQDQLLGIVVAKDRPELEEKKNTLIIESAANRKTLKEVEDKILEILSTSEGNILEDETAIKVLTSSKKLSEDIQAKQEIAVVTEVEIDTARDKYVPASKHASALFFCITELANIDPMYQYSLVWFIGLYEMSIANSEHSEDLDYRLQSLNDHFTSSIYRNVCRSLFEKDKLIFSFVLCIGIMRYHGLVEEDLFTFFLTGGVALENPHANPAPLWLTDKSWAECCRASALNGLENLMTSIQKSPQNWKSFYDQLNPHERNFPAPCDRLKDLRRLIALRCLRPDKIVPAVQQYVVDQMSREFIEPPAFNLEACYNDSNPCSPLIFVLSPGSDPMLGLLRFAADMRLKKNAVHTISLGQGQGPIAAAMIDDALRVGHWVVLQNCHLAVSWMKELDRICDEVSKGKSYSR